MKRVVWLSDIHLNFLLAEPARAFLAEVAAARPDAVLISGDIGEAHNVCDYLALIAESIGAPVYFVLGNHDFYFGSIRETRGQVAALCASHPQLHYLTVEDLAELTPRVALVGHDGWADGRLGNYVRSLVMMHDYKLIGELAGLNKLDRWEVLKSLADEAAAHLRSVLPPALARYRDVVLLTHVPPLREACWHEGRLSDDDWAPHFTCQATGRAILDIMREHPHNQLTVLCGHTHGAGETHPLPNLHVLTAGAEYGAPTITRVFEFD
jgi:predicted MPP superfamily phosphohydrolase